jgi:hypothetical protein
MFQRMIDDFKRDTGIAVRLSSLAVVVAFGLFITTAFLCAAAFVFVLQSYGLLYACLAGAAVFFVVTLLAGGCYFRMKKQSEKRVAEAVRHAAPNIFADPAMLAAGLQIVRIVGIKRMVPLLAIGGIAFGLLVRRNQQADEPAE